MLQRKLDSRNQETKLVARIVTRSFKAHGIKRPLLQQRSHRVSNLNLADGAGAASVSISSKMSGVST